jgi:hypothetical protein
MNQHKIINTYTTRLYNTSDNLIQIEKSVKKEFDKHLNNIYGSFNVCGVDVPACEALSEFDSKHYIESLIEYMYTMQELHSESDNGELKEFI